MSASDNGQAMSFEVVKIASTSDGLARLGRLIKAGRAPIETPNFIAVSRRGAVPHVTSDTVARYRPFEGVYLGLEDFIEKNQKAASHIPAIYKAQSTHNGEEEKEGPISSFTALPSDIFTVLAARRHPAAASHLPNGKNDISVFTSQGFRNLTNEQYREAIRTLKPDIAIPLADLTYSDVPATSKRTARMAQRTEEWMEQMFKSLPAAELRDQGTAIFAPTLPVPYSKQWEYLDMLAENHEQLSGLAIYDKYIVPELTRYHHLLPLPRLSLDTMDAPQRILFQVSIGIDIFTLPTMSAASDAGLAFTFSFPSATRPPSNTEDRLPLAIDLSDTSHQTSVTPLYEGCECYACTSHHRAYITHLLDAKEMLAWTLLQIHNHHLMSTFFADIRKSLAQDTFEEDARLFHRMYEEKLPEGKATRPRARGYHFKSEGGDEKRNKPAWGALGSIGAAGAIAAGDSRVETPLVPNDEDAVDLNRKGFAQVAR